MFDWIGLSDLIEAGLRSGICIVLLVVLAHIQVHRPKTPEFIFIGYAASVEIYNCTRKAGRLQQKYR